MEDVGSKKDYQNKLNKFISNLKPNNKSVPYYFLLPVLMVFCIFMIYPIIKSFILSFYKFKGGVYEFVGIKIIYPSLKMQYFWQV